MQMRSLLGVCATLLVAAGTLLAADVTGKWTAEMQGRGGRARTVTFDLKQDGATLTGTVSGPMGRENAISDGKVDGDDISFTVNMEFNGNSMKINYTGKVSGDTIQFRSQREGGERTQEFTAKKAS